MKFIKYFAALLFAVLCINTSRAQDTYPEYITDVIVIGDNSKNSVNTLMNTYKDKGYTFCDVNLNDGAGGDIIYVGYKTGSRASTNGGYITDLKIFTKSQTSITYDERTYYRADCDGRTYFTDRKGNLNCAAKENSDNMWLYYTMDNFSDKRVVNEIITTIGEKNQTKTGYTTIGKNGGTTPYDLNDNAGGAYVYMLFSTTTKINRPATDPTFYSNLVYNGQEQQLIQYGPQDQTMFFGGTGKGNLMYYYIEGIEGSTQWDITKVTAKNAGDYTLKYYATNSDYGDRSENKSKIVTIANSPNSNATVNIASSIDGKENVNPTVINNLSSGSITFQYSKSSGSGFSTNKPNAPGTWYVKATIAADGNCNAYTTGVKSFTLIDWEGEGTASSPYLIKSTADLDRLAQRANASSKYNGKYFRVENDIVYSGSDNNYTAIGTNSYPFEGNFNGNGKAISGIIINKPSSDYQGLFGIVGNRGVVQNVLMVNANIKGNSSKGVICGLKMGTLTSNYYINCTVNDKTTHIGTPAGDGYGTNSLHTLSLGDNITTSTAATKTYNNNKYYANGTEITLAYNGTIPEGAQLFYTVNNGTPTTSNKFKMPAASTTVNASIEQCYTISLDDGISIKSPTNPTLTSNDGTNYYKQGTKITLEYAGKDGIKLNNYTVNGNKISGNTFHMPNKNTEVAANTTDLWNVNNSADGSEEHPYIITSTEGLDYLASKVNSGTSYKSKSFELGNKIEYDKTINNYTPIGVNGPFEGYFNGKGYTISGICIDGNNIHQGVFGYTMNAVIKNITLTDAVIKGDKYIGGIVGNANDNCLIENCKITNTVTLTGSQYIGGICGYIGYYINKVIVCNCLVIGAKVNCDNDDKGFIAGKNNGTLENNYYLSCTLNSEENATNAGCNSQDVTDKNGAVSLLTISLGEGIKVSSPSPKYVYNQTNYYAYNTEITLAPSSSLPEGALIYYSVNGGEPTTNNKLTLKATNTTVTAKVEQYYSLTTGNGISVTPSEQSVFTANGKNYYKKGTQFTFSYATKDGIIFNGYIVNGKAITGNTFTLSNENAEVAASVTDLWNVNNEADGSESNPYIITSTAGLDYLASQVNGGKTYKNTYFELGSKIEYDNNIANNYTPIGAKNHFNGKFDGNGYTISGIRIDGNNNTQGVFGYIDDAEVKNIILSDAVIKGYELISGIAGMVRDSKISNCLVINTEVGGYDDIGMIAGYKAENCTLTNNFYYPSNSIKGCNGEDIEGAQLATANQTPPSLIGDLTADYGERFKVYENGLYSQGTYYYRLKIQPPEPEPISRDYVLDFTTGEPVEIERANFGELMKWLVFNTAYCNISVSDRKVNIDLNRDGMPDINVKLETGSLSLLPGVKYISSNYSFELTEKCNLVFKFNDRFQTVDAIQLFALKNDDPYNAMYLEEFEEFEEIDDVTLNIILQGHTLYRDGRWNTIYLPFNVNLEDYFSPLYQAEAYKLNTASFNENTNTINADFTLVDELQAYVPYIIRWDKDLELKDLQDPIFFYAKLDFSALENHSNQTNVSLNGTVDPINYRDVTIPALSAYIAVGIPDEEKTALYPAKGIKLFANNGELDISADDIAIMTYGEPRSIENVTVLPATFTGKPLRPILKDGDYTLVERIDYIITDENGESIHYFAYPDKYPIRIIGKGQYSGIANKEFEITETKPEDYIIDLTSNMPFVMNVEEFFNVFMVCSELNNAYYNVVNSNSGQITTLDLNRDGTPDADISYDYDYVYITRLPGAKAIKTNISLALDEQTADRTEYEHIVFKLGNDYQSEEAIQLFSLKDNSIDNSLYLSKLKQFNITTLNVMLQGRTLHRDGRWNNIYLPFSVDLTDPNSPLYQATAYPLLPGEIEGNTIKVELGSPIVDELKANVPYLIKWDEKSLDDLQDPIFMSVTLENSLSYIIADDDEEEDYSKLAISYGSFDMTRYVGGSIGACRAAFYIGEPNDDNYALYPATGYKLDGDDLNISADDIAILTFGEPLSIDKVTVLPATYTGTPLKPIIKDGDYTLVEYYDYYIEGANYKGEYINSNEIVEPGVYTVYLKGGSMYSGTTTKEFVISQDLVIDLNKNIESISLSGKEAMLFRNWLMTNQEYIYEFNPEEMLLDLNLDDTPDVIMDGGYELYLSRIEGADNISTNLRFALNEDMSQMLGYGHIVFKFGNNYQTEDIEPEPQISIENVAVLPTVYNGEPQMPVIKDGDYTLVYGKDYLIRPNEFIMPVDDDDITGNPKTGNPKTGIPTTGNPRELVGDVEPVSGVDVGGLDIFFEGFTEVGFYPIVIMGIGKYTGTAFKEFYIYPEGTTFEYYGPLTITTFDESNKIATLRGDFTDNENTPLNIEDIHNNIYVTELTFERKFYKGVTSTVIFPFSFAANTVKGNFYTLASVAPDKDGVWTATMSKAIEGTIAANTPYIFVPDEDIYEITFQGVTITSEFPKKLNTQREWQLHGVYSKITWGADANQYADYGFAGEEVSEDNIKVGDFVRAGEGAWVDPMRCYLTYHGNDQRLKAKASTVLPNRIRVVFPTEDDETEVIEQPVTPEIITPVAETAPENDIKVWSYNHTIYIESQPDANYTIIDLSGRIIKTGVTHSTREEVTLNRNAGIVIVNINGKSFKVNL